MPKKTKETAKTPNKTLDLDKKIDAIKGEIDKIIDEEEQQIETEEIKQPLPPVQPIKKQPKIIEEIVEEEDPEPIIIRKIIKKKPKQIIEEIIEEDDDDNEPVKEQKPKKKENRGRPFGSIKKPKEEYNIESKNRNRFDTILDEGNIELLRREMKNEMRRRLMTSLFD